MQQHCKAPPRRLCLLHRHRQLRLQKVLLCRQALRRPLPNPHPRLELCGRSAAASVRLVQRLEALLQLLDHALDAVRVAGRHGRARRVVELPAQRVALALEGAQLRLCRLLCGGGARRIVFPARELLAQRDGLRLHGGDVRLLFGELAAQGGGLVGGGVAALVGLGALPPQHVVEALCVVDEHAQRLLLVLERGCLLVAVGKLELQRLGLGLERAHVLVCGGQLLAQRVELVGQRLSGRLGLLRRGLEGDALLLAHAQLLREVPAPLQLLVQLRRLLDLGLALGQQALDQRVLRPQLPDAKRGERGLVQRLVEPGLLCHLAQAHLGLLDSLLKVLALARAVQLRDDLVEPVVVVLRDLARLLVQPVLNLLLVNHARAAVVHGHQVHHLVQLGLQVPHQPVLLLEQVVELCRVGVVRLLLLNELLLQTLCAALAAAKGAAPLERLPQLRDCALPLVQRLPRIAQLALRGRQPVLKPEALLARVLDDVAALRELAHNLVDLAAVVSNLGCGPLLQRLDLALEPQRALAVLQRELLHVVVLVAPVHDEVVLALVLGAQVHLLAGHNLEEGLELHDAPPQRADVFGCRGVKRVVWGGGPHVEVAGAEVVERVVNLDVVALEQLAEVVVFGLGLRHAHPEGLAGALELAGEVLGLVDGGGRVGSGVGGVVLHRGRFGCCAGGGGAAAVVKVLQCSPMAVPAGTFTLALALTKPLPRHAPPRLLLLLREAPAVLLLLCLPNPHGHHQPLALHPRLDLHRITLTPLPVLPAPCCPSALADRLLGRHRGAHHLCAQRRELVPALVARRDALKREAAAEAGEVGRVVGLGVQAGRRGGQPACGGGG
ncbi:hypothetical protein DFP73DRAFT_561373 [Morchella snyderi]|nr:hypothetical protein DFP73DRAFT_561373 [Morchella snyderi]